MDLWIWIVLLLLVLLAFWLVVRPSGKRSNYSGGGLDFFDSIGDIFSGSD